MDGIIRLKNIDVYNILTSLLDQVTNETEYQAINTVISNWSSKHNFSDTNEIVMSIDIEYNKITINNKGKITLL